MKTIYLHIGTHKTGTTSIQHFLYANQKVLKQIGFDYLPRNCVWEAHHPLGWEFHAVGQTNKTLCPWNEYGVINHLEDEINDSWCNTFIISSENLFKIKNRNFAERFFQRFQDYDIHVIVYLREQSSFIESWYYELTRNDSYKLDEAIDSFIKNPRYNLDYYSVLKEWREFVDNENIHAFNFHDVAKKSGLVHNFLYSIGVQDTTRFSYPEKKNEKINYAQLLMMRIINKMEISKEDWFKAQDIILGDDKIKELENVSILTCEQERIIKNTYLDSNKQLCESFNVCFG